MYGVQFVILVYDQDHFKARKVLIGNFNFIVFIQLSHIIDSFPKYLTSKAIKNKLICILIFMTSEKY